MKKILLVEDTESLAENMTDLLSNLGFEVKVAMNGQEALSVLSDYRPDLIITDVLMPVMDGLTLTNTIRRDIPNPAIPIIILSAKGTPDDIKAGLDAGADIYLKKPCSVEELINAIGTVLNY
jgi:DNA-binding response OmpR family regulator